MKSLAVVVVTLTLCLQAGPLCYAHLGETLDQCKARYGEPKKIVHPPDDRLIQQVGFYEKDGYAITCFFNGGNCCSVRISRASDQSQGDAVPLTDVELANLRDAHGSGKKWARKESTVSSRELWETEDGIRSASVEIGHKSITISTKEFVLRAGALATRGRVQPPVNTPGDASTSKPPRAAKDTPH